MINGGRGKVGAKRNKNRQYTEGLTGLHDAPVRSPSLVPAFYISSPSLTLLTLVVARLFGAVVGGCDRVAGAREVGDVGIKWPLA